MHDFGKPWWGVAYVPCMTNLRARYAWAIRWHVTCMLSLAEHWQGRRVLSNHVCAHSVIHVYQCGAWFVCSTLREVAVSNLGQLLFCLSITWSRCRNAYRDLWIMTVLYTLYMLHTCSIMHTQRICKFENTKHRCLGMFLHKCDIHCSSRN